MHMAKKKLEESSSSEDLSSDDEYKPEIEEKERRGRGTKKSVKNEDRKVAVPKRTRTYTRKLKLEEDDMDSDKIAKRSGGRNTKKEPAASTSKVSDVKINGHVPVSKSSIATHLLQQRKAFNVINSLFNTALNLKFKSLSLNQSYDYCLNNVTKVLLPTLTSIPISMNKIESPRIMSLTWHPTDPNVLIVGGKHGEIYRISDFEFAIPSEEKLPSAKNEQIVEGIGPAGGLTQMKYDPNNYNHLFTTSIAGVVARLDLETMDHLALFQVEEPRGDNLDHWFTALDVDEDKGRIQVGDNKGNFHFMPKNLEGSKKSSFSSYRLHKTKITSIDHYPKQPNLVVSCSVDKFVKVWDLRMVKEEKPIKVIEFDGPIEAGFFSKTNGGTFVTSDQRQNVKKFCTSSWAEELSIKHAQDTFQHLTPIKGCWHPSTDVFGIARYNKANKADSGKIDFWNMKTGEEVYTLDDPKYNGIKSVTTWNCVGDTLAVSQFSNLIIYKKKEFLESIFEKKLTIDKRTGKGPTGVKSRDQLFLDFLDMDKNQNGKDKRKKTTEGKKTINGKKKH